MKDIFLLDMDETLLDFSRAEEANFFWALASFGVQADRGVYERFHVINDSLWKALERGETTREEIMHRRFELLFAEYGFTADPDAVALAYFENFTNVCFPYAGAADFLKTLSERGRVYIVTNGSTGIQKRHIKDAGFEPYLTGVFISEEMGVYKPAKEYADYVKAHVEDFEEARAIWLGDSLTSDMGCANNANVDFVLFAPKGKPQGYAGKWVANYDDFLKLIE